jgi:glutamate dehydrogenase (NAD(P)+)
MIDGLESLDGARIAIQGLGQVGGTAMRLFHEAGAPIVAVSDSSGGVADDGGLNPDNVLAHKEKFGTVVGLPETKTITNDDLIACDCDILIPAALEGQIRGDNADSVKARLVVEAANGPVTPAGDELLQKREVIVVPDIVANGGGVIVSYFEWVQNLQNQQWDLDKVERNLEKRITRSVDDMIGQWKMLRDVPQAKRANRPAPTLRDAALVLAVRKVSDVILHRDIWL